MAVYDQSNSRHSNLTTYDRTSEDPLLNCHFGSSIPTKCRVDAEMGMGANACSDRYCSLCIEG
ncbi:hypothetical protein K432DRAFT_378988 [Lepidopterella palustris CBS 459.81]|uniref:Uncharacterized protein n=1 Tax=Lepidopterella palustris CBS 459.81 TaxID=1314670 RepID=A0A8E2JIJ4_9PEZI|nr:hypothetical protein K432DRAFT_378988 [Lepidopterella palustris CBS 459.81]